MCKQLHLSIFKSLTEKSDPVISADKCAWNVGAFDIDAHTVSLLSQNMKLVF